MSDFLERIFKMKKILMSMIVCAIVFYAFPYSYSCFPMMSGKRTIVANPYAYVYNFKSSTTVGADLLAAVGITDNIDVWANVGSITFIPDFSYNSWWGMVRYAITKNNLAAILANDEYISLQYHGMFFETTHWYMQNNTGLNITYNSNDLSLWTCITPGYKFNSKFDIFCDIIPITGFKQHTQTLRLVPGIGINLSNNSFSLGIIMDDVTNKPDYSIGLWWYHSWNF